MSNVAALFVQPRSHYAELGCECFDLARDARSFDLACPVVAHPPCRAWGKFSGMAKPREDERDLSWWALHVVRHCGGVLEHPQSSQLWREAGCSSWGVRDRFGGVLVPALQRWWGHRAQKATCFYVVAPVPVMPCWQADVCDAVPVERMCRQERERTPVNLARWLVDVARSAA